MQVTFDHFRSESPNIGSFYFLTDSPLQFTAGQFVQLTIPHENPDERGEKRWFTLSSSPTQDKVCITTKFAAGHGSSYKEALRTLKPGFNLTMGNPMGDFVLPKSVETPLIFVAGGIGVTPFLSMLQWLKDTGEERPIKMLQAVSTEDDIAFQDIFDAAKQHATIVVARPSTAWGGERGRLSAEMVLGIERPSPDTLLYISGPEQLVESLTADLQQAGVNKQQIVGDYFPGYADD